MSRLRANDAALRLAPALAGLAAVLAAAAWQSDRAGAPATAWLGSAAAAVLAPLALVVERERLPLALLHLLAPAAAVYLPRHGAAPLAALALLFAAALALVAADRARSPRPLGTRGFLALALAAQTLVHFDRLYTAPRAAETALLLLVLPALAAPLLAALARRDRAAALAAALALAAGGPGLTAAGVAALAVGALAARFRPRAVAAAPLLAALPAGAHEPVWAAAALAGCAAATALPPLRLARAARALLACLAFGALLAAAPPWLRGQPIASLLDALARPPLAAVDEPLAHRSVTLSAGAPREEWALSGAPISRLAIDSFLSDGVSLACGRSVATVRIHARGAEPVEAPLTVGSATGEWASARPAVAAALACRDLRAFAHWIPAEGRALGRSFRAVVRLPRPLAAERVEIVRAEELRAGVRLHVQRVASAR